MRRLRNPKRGSRVAIFSCIPGTKRTTWLTGTIIAFSDTDDARIAFVRTPFGIYQPYLTKLYEADAVTQLGDLVADDLVEQDHERE